MKWISIALFFLGFPKADGQEVMTRLESLGNRNIALQNTIYAHEQPFMAGLDCKHMLMYESLAQKTILISNMIELIEYAVMVQRECGAEKSSWLQTRSASNLQQLPAMLHRMKANPNENNPTYGDEVDLQQIINELDTTLALISSHRK